MAAHHRVGVNCSTCLTLFLSNPGSTAARYSLTGTSSRRHDSWLQPVKPVTGPVIDDVITIRPWSDFLRCGKRTGSTGCR